MIDSVVKCTLCGAGMGKCNCWKPNGQPYCAHCEEDGTYRDRRAKKFLCLTHYAELQVKRLKPKTEEQRELWMKETLEILRQDKK